MKTHEIRNKFLTFFEQRGHNRIQSDSLIPHNDPTLLFTGAGMNQFKEYFLGLKKDIIRATSSQKCLRTGDLDNVGKTAYHHSFFEMLGNFSFGDYFKKDAIKWAWEFLTSELSIPVERLRVSVHKNDHESFDLWNSVVGVASDRIYRFGDKENFWPSNAPQDGPNGPCGPCSEIFFDQGQQYGCQRIECSPACDCGRFAEIWNLVFTQFERKDGGVLVPLPTQNIDTGMGLERIACVVQGKKNNYEIDVFAPLIFIICETCKRPRDDGDVLQGSIYAIADHMRAVVFSISDGAYPSNEGRGYVIRKLLRRSVYHGHLLGIKHSFLHTLVPIVVDIFSNHYLELAENMQYVYEIVKSEEERFLTTLDGGLVMLNELIDHITLLGKTEISGADVFRLYDTYGFPDELTKIIAGKSGLSIDENGFNEEMSRQQERAKHATVISDSIFVSTELDKFLVRQPATVFTGYTTCVDSGTVIALLCENTEKERLSSTPIDCVFVLDKTPFYAESGGQVGDSGEFIFDDGGRVLVKNTFKKDEVTYHVGTVVNGCIAKGTVVKACVDQQRRMAIMRNHTATHLLQAVLRKILGPLVRQLGSLVTEDKLRFDFSYPKALTEEQKITIEEIVNKSIQDNQSLAVRETTLDEAKLSGALAFFGDRYGTHVRMVSVGEFSKELCGGTHLSNTGLIGKFKIMSESSIASGIRRIEACTADKAEEFSKQKQREIIDHENKKKAKQKEEEQRRLYLDQLKSGLMCDAILSSAVMINGYTFISYMFDNLSQGDLRELYDAIKTKIKQGIVALIANDNGKLAILVALTKDLLGAHISADEIVAKLMSDIEGSGGGKKMMAFAGTREVDKIPFIQQKLKSIINELIV